MLTNRFVAVAALVCSVSARAESSSGLRYFPPEFAKVQTNCLDVESGKPGPVLSDLETRWYSSQLVAAQEPSLYRRSTMQNGNDGLTLRFTWLRSFHPPIIVRVERLGSNRPTIIAKKLSKGGFAPGHVSDSLSRPLSHQEQRNLQAAMETSKILSMTPRECYHGSAGMLTIRVDGSEWIVEAVDRDGYHFVDRWSPQDGPVHDVGLMLLQMTGWQLKPIY